jgi:hypothetical protein
MEEQHPEKHFLTQVLMKLSSWWESTKPLGLLREHLPHYAKPYATALSWAQELSTKEVSEPHRAIVRRALEREGIKAPTSEEVERWALELPSELSAVLAGLGLEEVSAPEIYEPICSEGMFFLDARAAKSFEKRGALQMAKALRTQGLEHWENYLGARSFSHTNVGRMAAHESVWWLFANEKLEQEGLPPFPLAIFVARALIQLKRVKDPIPTPTKEETAQTKEPVTKELVRTGKALPVETVSTWHIEVAKIYNSTYKPEEVKLSADFSQVLRNGEVIASVPSLPKRELALLQRGLHQVGGLTFKRAVNYFIRACWDRYQKGETRPDRLTFPGVGDLAERIGETSDKGTTSLMNALAQGQHFVLDWPGGIIGGLWMYYYQKPRTGRKAFLEVELSRVLRPHYGMAELDSPWRVPVVQLAPMVGRHNEHAAQAALQERLMIELVERRADLLKYGGARIIDQQWRRLAEEVGLPEKTLPAVLERWQHTAQDGEAFLEKNGDHYLLATTKPYRAAREFLLEAGRRSIAAKESGKKGVLIHVSHLKGQPKRRNKIPKK